MNKIPVIIDTDPGVDDAAAILLALASPELDVLGLTIVAGNVGLDASVRNGCRLVALAGREDVPVVAGASGPLVREQVLGRYAHVGDFPDDVVEIEPVAPAKGSAVMFIAEKARDAAARGETITICAIGPLTNIALALRIHPDVARGIGQIVVMGGAFAEMGHRTPFAEYNVLADPHATAIVWQSGVDVVQMPLDVTFQALFAEDDFAQLEAQDSPGGILLAALLRRFDRSDVARFGRPGGPIHDAMTVAYLIKPDLFSGSDCAVGVTLTGSTAGQTWADFNSKTSQVPKIHVIQHVDEAGYRRLMVDRIAGLRASSKPISHAREFHA